MQIDPATWRKLTLRVEKQDETGSVAVTLLRPSSWFAAELESTTLGLLENAADEVAQQWEELPAWARWIDQAECVASGDAFFDIADTSAPWLDLSGHLASTGSPLGLLDWGRSQLVASVVEELDYDAALADITTDIENGGGIGDEIPPEMSELGAVGFAELELVASVACPAIAGGIQRRYNLASQLPATHT